MDNSKPDSARSNQVVGINVSQDTHHINGELDKLSR